MQDRRKRENIKEEDKTQQKDKIDEKDDRKEEKTAKVSFLTAFFEGKDNSSTSQHLNTSSRRSKRNRQRKIIDLKDQMRIDTFLKERGKNNRKIYTSQEETARRRKCFIGNAHYTTKDKEEG